MLERFEMELLCKILILSSFFISAVNALMSYSAKEGEAFVLSCPLPEVSVTWCRMPDCQYFSSNDKKRVHAVGSKLWFLPTSMNDKGIYMCGTQETNTNISLNVYESIQESCPGKPRMKELKLTKNFIKCPVNFYDNITKISWYKECKLLQGQHDTMLYISDISKSDTGTYTCSFTYMYNGKPYNATRNIPVRVSEKSIVPYPRIHGRFNDTIVAEVGTSVNMFCSAFVCITCKTDFDLFWRVNGNRINNSFRKFRELKRTYSISSYEIYTESNLTILKVENNDYMSNYSCIAYNNKGKDEMIRILKPPEPDRMDPMFFSVIVLGAFICLLLLLYTRYKIDLVLLCRDIFKKYHYRNDGKEYDAYVIYPSTCNDNSADYFANTVLPEVLENKCGFRLFVPGRNAVPGDDVSSSSAINIEKSRRLIIVLNAEKRSMESLYDQEIGLYSALINNSLKVIIITLGKMNENTEMQESLRYIMNQKGSIQWDDKSNDTLSPNSQFWKRVRYQMPTGNLAIPAKTV